MRKTIYTDVAQINKDNVVDVLLEAINTHIENVADIDFLEDFDAGIQPMSRIKQTRKDIDNHFVDNVAHEIVDFNKGYYWSTPITLVQRGEKDSGNADEIKAIALLNECYNAESFNGKFQEAVKHIEICNMGYVHIGINMDYTDGDSYFTYNVVDPRYAFIVKSNAYMDKRDIMSVTFSVDKQMRRHYTCVTKDTRYEVFEDKVQFAEKNPLGMLPLIRWFANYDDMGCFEHQLSACNELNQLYSDYGNALEQNIDSYWHGNDVDFPVEQIKDESGKVIKEVVKKPLANEWILTETTPNGKQPFIKPLTLNQDYSGMLNNIRYRRNLILQKCHVPQRNDDSGGSTGIAMQNATGYTVTEIVADTKEAIQSRCKMQEVKVVLAAIKASPFVPQDSPLLKLRYSDVQPNIKRMKLSEMATKVNSWATLLSHGADLKAASEIVNLFPDVNQFVIDSKETVKAYQDSIFNKAGDNQAEGGEGEKKPNADRIMQDMSDQVSQSPFLKG